MANRCFVNLSSDEKSRFIGLLARPDTTFADLASSFDLHIRVIMRAAAKLLTPEEYRARLSRKGRPFTADRRVRVRKGGYSLSEVRDRLAELKRQQASLNAEIHSLQEEEVTRSIYFELDGEDVRVFGITPEEVIADYRQWLRFLNHSGGARLREFIEGHFVKKP